MLNNDIDTPIIKLPELLTPAGNMNSFYSAVENGADAVYIGTKEFSARQYAENFTDKEIASAVKYAHLRGVKTYLTLNTLIFDDEFNKAMEIVYNACCNDIDAVIVQDLGLASKIRKYFPQLRLHASTQMTVHNFEGVNLLKKLGFSRVVLSRELSLEQIAEINNKLQDIELEIFVHGALCVGYSGQCLLSSMIGDRSGNRGRCAQPCRQPYELIDKITNQKIEDIDGFLLSTKDLCTLGILPDIVNSGLKSLKIEGRMKSPEYVATVTRIYRKYLDFISLGRKYTVSDSDYEDLKLVYNRGGFTKGFIGGESGADLMSQEFASHNGIIAGKVIDFDEKQKLVTLELATRLGHGDVIKIKPNDEGCTTVTKIILDGEKIKSARPEEIVRIGTNQNWKNVEIAYKVFDKKLSEKAAKTYSGKIVKRVPLYAEFNLAYGNPIELSVWDDEGTRVDIKGNKPADEAKKISLSPEKVLEQLESMGNTPFYLAKAQIEMEAELFLPLAEINEVRRKAIEAISKERIERAKKTCMDEKSFKGIIAKLAVEQPKAMADKKKELSIVLPDSELLETIKDLDFKRVYIPARDFFEDKIIPNTIDKLINNDKEVFLAFPRITTKTEHDEIYEKIKRINNYNFSGALIGNLGQVKMFKIIKDFKVQAGFSFNVFNKFAVEKLKSMGIDGVTMSPELDLKHLLKIVENGEITKEIIVHGNFPLMVSNFCIIQGALKKDSKDEKACGLCKDREFGLVDKTLVEFPLKINKRQCGFELYNSKKMCLAWDFEAIKGLKSDYYRINFTNEGKNEIIQTISLYGSLLSNNNYNEVLNEYSELLEGIKQKGFTRGHYFRKVE